MFSEGDRAAAGEHQGGDREDQGHPEGRQDEQEGRPPPTEQEDGLDCYPPWRPVYLHSELYDVL